MSYDLRIFNVSIKQKFDAGFRLDEFEPPPLEAMEVERFLKRLTAYGYGLEGETPLRKGFVKQINGCPIQVGVYATEIAFSVPYWGNQQAIFDALQDASEMCDSGRLALFDPQAGQWLSGD